MFPTTMRTAATRGNHLRTNRERLEPCMTAEDTGPYRSCQEIAQAQGLDIAPWGKRYAYLHGTRAAHRGGGREKRRQPQGASAVRSARHPSPGGPVTLRLSPLLGRRAGAPDVRGAGPPAWTHAGRDSPYRRAAPVGRASLRSCPDPAGAEAGRPRRAARGSAPDSRLLARDDGTTGRHLPAHRSERR